MAQLSKQQGQVVVVGDMTMTNTQSLLSEWTALSVDVPSAVDLAGVTDVDTSTISLMFEWLRQSRARDCQLHFLNLPHNLTSLATLYGVLDLIPTGPAVAGH
ncbi:STAS domain-containing protein [Pseudomethylobacillus aquaticus]|nr:STAS domain-containing protein [Pseudomethylobacillus aquaticus]